MKRLFLGITGASGAVYGIRLAEVLVRAGIEVALCVSEAGAKVLRYEMDLEVDPYSPDPGILCPRGGGLVSAYPIDQVEAPVSSGSHRSDGAVICPCSMGTVGAIAHGLSGNLIERAADVMLKERRTLIVVPREAPMTLIHLRNLAAIAEVGGNVVPAAPGFYHRPQSIEDLVDQVILKITDLCGLELDLIERWSGR